MCRAKVLSMKSNIVKLVQEIDDLVALPDVFIRSNLPDGNLDSAATVNPAMAAGG